MRLRYLAIGSLISLAMIPYFNGCNKDLSPLNTNTASSYAPTPTPVPTPSTMPVILASELFDNFEYGLDFNAAWCCPPTGCWGWPCSAQIEWSADFPFNGGTHSWKIKKIRNNNPGDSWSGWASLDGCLMTPPKTDFTGAGYVKLFMRASANIRVRFHWYELGTAPGGSDDWAVEANVPAGTGPISGWTYYSWPLSAFHTACPPGGDGIPNVDKVSALWVDFVTAPPCGSSATMSFAGFNDLYIDEVMFSATP